MLNQLKAYLKQIFGLFGSKPEVVQTWPFPIEKEATPCSGERTKKRKPAVKKVTTRKPKVVAKTARTKKAK